VKLEIERHFAILNLILEMDVLEAVVLLCADVGEGKIVRADETDRTACQESAYDAFGSDEAVFRVCALGGARRAGRGPGGCFSARSQMWRRRVISA